MATRRADPRYSWIITTIELDWEPMEWARR